MQEEPSSNARGIELAKKNSIYKPQKIAWTSKHHHRGLTFSTENKLTS